MDPMGYSWISISVEDDRNPLHLGVYLAQPGAHSGINFLAEIKITIVGEQQQAARRSRTVGRLQKGDRW